MSVYKQWKIVFAFCTIPLLFLVIFLVFVPQHVAMPSHDATDKEWTAYWRDRIETHGGKSAYGEFAELFANDSIGTQHKAAHIFGSALFHIEGVGGLSVCDSRFSFGCFHEFLGEAIATLGMEIVPLLDEGCKKSLSTSPLSCQHGIGHGILAFEGYDEASLEKTLILCRDLVGTNHIGGCPGGAFMEYNLRTMLGSEATPRSFGGDPFVPCTTLDESFLEACVYWLPQWWLQEVFRPLPKEERFVRMGDLCRTLKNSAVERNCFEGLGNLVFIEAGAMPDRAKNLCDVASRSERERVFCRATAANTFGINVGDAAAEKVCEGFTGDVATFCLQYAHNKNNVIHKGEFIQI